MRLGYLVSGWLAVSSFATVGVVRAQDWTAPLSPADTASYRMVKVAKGVFAFIAPDGITPAVSGNSTVVIGDDGVLVVDTGQYPDVTRWEIEKIRALTDKPVRYVVNTHWHPDHWLGNGEFLAAFPDAVIVSTPVTLELMKTQAQPFIDPKVAAGTVAALRQMTASGVGRDGRPIPDPTLRWYRYGLGEVEALLPQLERAAPAYPTRMVSDSMVFSLGGRDVQVRFLGRGNTGGDLVAYVPDTRTLVTGDLVVHPYPYVFGSFVGEWIETMTALIGFDAAGIVPGHGAVENDKRYLVVVKSLLESLRRQVGEAFRRGVPLDSVAGKVDFAEFRRRMCGKGEYCRYGFDSSIKSAIGRAYREAKEGRLSDEN